MDEFHENEIEKRKGNMASSSNGANEIRGLSNFIDSFDGPMSPSRNSPDNVALSDPVNPNSPREPNGIRPHRFDDGTGYETGYERGYERTRVNEKSMNRRRWVSYSRTATDMGAPVPTVDQCAKCGGWCDCKDLWIDKADGEIACSKCMKVNESNHNISNHVSTGFRVEGETYESPEEEVERRIQENYASYEDKIKRWSPYLGKFKKIKEKASSFTAGDYEELRDIGFHNLSAVFLAYKYGNDKQIAFMETLHKAHLKHGGGVYNGAEAVRKAHDDIHLMYHPKLVRLTDAKPSSEWDTRKADLDAKHENWGNYVGNVSKIKKYAPKFTMADYEELEDINYHHENIMFLAFKYGTAKEQEIAVRFYKKHQELGHLPQEDAEGLANRDTIHKKYYDRLAAEAKKAERAAKKEKAKSKKESFDFGSLANKENIMGTNITLTESESHKANMESMRGMFDFVQGVQSGRIETRIPEHNQSDVELNEWDGPDDDEIYGHLTWIEEVFTEAIDRVDRAIDHWMYTDMNNWFMGRFKQIREWALDNGMDVTFADLKREINEDIIGASNSYRWDEPEADEAREIAEWVIKCLDARKMVKEGHEGNDGYASETNQVGQLNEYSDDPDWQDAYAAIAQKERTTKGSIINNAKVYRGGYLDAFLHEIEIGVFEGLDGWMTIETLLDRDWIVNHELNGDHTAEAWDDWTEMQSYSDWESEGNLRSWLDAEQVETHMQRNGYDDIWVKGQGQWVYHY